MSSPWSLWQEFALAALGTLSLLYVLVFRVWTAEALGADGVFVLAVAAAVATVAAPGLFDTGARQVVAWSPLPAALEEADARTRALAELPSRLIDGALARLGFDSDEDGATDDTDAEAVASESADVATDADTGPLSTHIRPSVEGLVALLLRVAAGAIAMLTLALAFLLRAVRGLARRLRRTSDRLDRLEAALATMDSDVGRLATPVPEGVAP